ncbi:MAG: malto-oligosyltrehalose trehalohydrolase [Kineosporiaceae bacterium]
MHRFRVWAPSASSVTLVLSGGPAAGCAAPMERDDGGWWGLDVEDAGPGTDYAFRLGEDEPALPDPRSAWQPEGVHGPSRVVDLADYDWRADWQGRGGLGAVFYELHVGTFTPEGTLDAAVDRLDHLVDLGVDVVELMPVAGFDGRWGWGYDGVDLYAVHDPYGGPEALQRFVDEAHLRGLAVCLDVVYNHLGPSGNYLSRFGPYFTDRHDTPWGPAVNLDDEGSHEVRRWICDNALRWLRDFRIDALRLDAVHALVDDSPRHLLQQLSDEVAEASRELGRPLALIAESDLNQPRMIEPVAEGGLGMTAQWSDDFHHALHSLLTGEQEGYYCDFGGTAVLARCLTRVFRHAGDLSTFRGQVWGAPVDPARHRGHRFLGYSQDHDQVGNRAVGDRLSASLAPGRLAAAAALVLTSPFTPMLFMGEEWGARTPWQFFTDFPDPQLAAAVRDGRRSEFSRHGWDAEDIPDPQDPATRERSVLDWAEVGKPEHERLLGWYRDLLTLRRAEADLRDDDLAAVRVDAGGTWVVVHRGGFAVAVNLAPAPATLRWQVEGEPPAPGADVVLAWDTATVVPDGVLLPGQSVAVLRRHRAATGSADTAAPPVDEG